MVSVGSLAALASRTLSGDSSGAGDVPGTPPAVRARPDLGVADRIGETACPARHPSRAGRVGSPAVDCRSDARNLRSAKARVVRVTFRKRHHGRRYIGGMRPFLPTVIRDVLSAPSGRTVAVTMTCAPGFTISRSPGSNVTIGASGGTT